MGRRDIVRDSMMVAAQDDEALEMSAAARLLRRAEVLPVFDGRFDVADPRE